jgi:sugar/nucleoside kinase (ribokinase family)
LSRAGVLCVGRVYCDLVFTDLPRLPTPGTEIFAGGLALHPGGGAAITAAYLAALGRPTHLAAILPAAPFGRPVRAALESLGVDCSLSQPAPAGSDPQLTVAMAIGEDRAFLTRDAGEAVPPLDPDAIRAAGIGHLHIGELRTLAARPDLLDMARAAELTVSLDCGWDDDLTEEVGALIAQVDLFLPNATELDRLAALGVESRPRSATVVKRGAEGSEAEGEQMPVRHTPVVDATGAGDAFNGGFVDAWLDGRGIARGLAAGNACGIHAVSHIGGVEGARVLAHARLTPAQ